MEGFGAGNVVLVDGHLLVLGDAGQLVLVEANPHAYKELARIDALEGKCWSTPAVADGRIYVRSTKEGLCLDVAQKTVRK
jgi:outer membrane protein assembly factor BamB